MRRGLCLLVALIAIALAAPQMASAARPRVSWQPTAGYSEGDPQVLLASELSVRDRDSRRLTRARVRIRGGPEPGEHLAFVRQRGITGTYNTGTGVLTLRGRASVASYQNALRSVWYRHSGDRPSAARGMEIAVQDDASLWSRRAVRTLQVAPVNDAPRLGPETGQFDYRPGSGAQRVAPGIALLDPDTRVAGATVQITSNFNSDQDELVFQNQRGITGTYNTGTGVLTLTGTRPVRDYQAALRSIAYSNSSSNPSPASRSITFQVTDALGAVSAPSILNEPNFTG